MSLETNFTVNYTAKTVTHSTGTEVFTVLAFFQWLAAKFAAEAQMDDDYPFVSDTPQVYRWVNGWDMGDDISYKFLKSGAIESSDAQKLYSNLYTIGSQFRNSMIYIIQSDAELTPWWSPGNIDVVIKVKTGGALIDSGKVMVLSRDSDGLYDHNEADLSAGGRNPVGVNTFEDGNYKLAGGVYTGDIYLDVDTIANFDVGNFAYGVTSLASGRIQGIDTPNTRLYLCQVEGTFGATETIVERATRDGSNLDGTATNSAVVDVIAGYTNVKALFVHRKFEGGTTAGTWVFGETVTQAGTGATGKFIADVSNVIYVEHTAGTWNGTGQLSGAAATYTPTSTTAVTTLNRDLNNGAGAVPYNVIVGCATRTMLQVYQYLKYITNHNSASVINGDAGEEYRSAKETDSYTESKQAPFGTFAGGVFFGARGIWVQDYATAAFQLIDANNAQQLPPNYQKVSVGHASLNGCQILVAERSGTAIVKDQYTIDTTTTTTIVVTTEIDATKVPQSGTLRVGDWKASYTSFSSTAKTFYGVSPDPSGKTGSLYVPQLDVLADAVTEESANCILDVAFDVKARVRKYGFKDYTMDTTFPTTGLAITPILATDPQAS